jgi:hypothetical protein
MYLILGWTIGGLSEVKKEGRPQVGQKCVRPALECPGQTIRMSWADSLVAPLASPISCRQRNGPRLRLTASAGGVFPNPKSRCVKNEAAQQP